MMWTVIRTLSLLQNEIEHTNLTQPSSPNMKSNESIVHPSWRFTVHMLSPRNPSSPCVVRSEGYGVTTPPRPVPQPSCTDYGGEVRATVRPAVQRVCLPACRRHARQHQSCRCGRCGREGVPE